MKSLLVLQLFEKLIKNILLSSCMMMPKYSPVRYTILTLEQPVPENKKVQRNAF